MSDYLNHLRFVHNTQTVLCLVIIYIVCANWTPGRELLHELDDFARTMHYSRDVVEKSERLAHLVPELSDQHAVMSEAISGASGPSVRAIAPIRVRQLTVLPAETSTVGVQWQRLKKHQWLLQTLGEPEEGWSEVRAWLDKWKCCQQRLGDILERRRRRRGRPSRFDIRRLKTPSVTMSVTDWPRDAKAVLARVEVAMYFPERWDVAGECCKKATSAAEFVDIVRDYKWNLLIGVKTFGPYRFVVQSTTVRLSQSTFDNYPHIQEDLSSIANLNLAEAVAWAGSRQVAGVRGRPLQLIGATIRGEHLGLVGPLAVAILHIYMLIMLHVVVSSLRNGLSPPTILSWAATMKLWLPTSYSLVTLFFLPGCTVFLTLWRLTAFDLYAVLICALILFCMGFYTMVLGRRVGQFVDKNAAGGARP